MWSARGGLSFSSYLCGWLSKILLMWSAWLCVESSKEVRSPESSIQLSGADPFASVELM